MEEAASRPILAAASLLEVAAWVGAARRRHGFLWAMWCGRHGGTPGDEGGRSRRRRLGLLQREFLEQKRRAHVEERRQWALFEGQGAHVGKPRSEAAKSVLHEALVDIGRASCRERV